VERNRIRRRLRAAVAECSRELLRGAAYLFEGERAVLSVTFCELRDAVRTLVAGACEDTA
jgi:ribonuclease P protein component